MTTSQRTVIPDSIRTNGATPNPWWSNAVVYQIYPRSFQDTNGDGLGDLKGITSRLDYLADLGVDVLWLSPVYKSPQDDNGYDISDYQDIDPLFGTLDDMDELLAEAHKRGLKIVMDLVVNHTSDEHAWFEASKNKDDEHADWYWWRPARPGTTAGEPGAEPNQWGSYFGGSAWEYCPERGEYYLHQFSKKQPDLNWENPAVRRAVYDMMNWWLEKGLSGFRIDAIINIKKDLNFPDFAPDGKDGLASCWKMVESVDGVGELLEDLKKSTFEKYDAFTVGEVFNMKPDELPEFIGETGHFSTIFDFSAHTLTDGEHGWYDAPKLEFAKWRAAIIQAQLETQKYGFKANIIENHDEPRGASRFLPSYAQTPDGIKMLGTISLLLRGIPFIYQGQEIGMKNAKWNSMEEFDDISTKDQYHTAREAGLSDQEALEVCSRMSRDNARTPMQWTSGENGGFTKGTPWLKVNPLFKDVNVEAQEQDPDSVLNYYRKLVALRKSDELKEVFTYGEFLPEYENVDGVMAFYRKDESKCILVAANFGKDAATIKLKSEIEKVWLSNRIDGTVDCEKDSLNLRSCEVVVLELENHK